jgi:hypothetical protein
MQFSSGVKEEASLTMTHPQARESKPRNDLPSDHSMAACTPHSLKETYLRMSLYHNDFSVLQRLFCLEVLAPLTVLIKYFEISKSFILNLVRR